MDELGGFAMTGARTAVHDGLDHILAHVEQIERDVEGNPASAVDLAKVIVEATCKRVLDERGQTYDAGVKFTPLYKQAIGCTPILPPESSADAELRKSLTQAIAGLASTVQGLGELRNTYGYASHGTGSPATQLGRSHGILAASAADAIVAFLWSCHRADFVRTQNRVPEYGEESAFDDAVDDAYGSIEVYDLTFRASYVLHELDPEAYRTYVNEFNASGLEEASGIVEEASATQAGETGQ